MELKRLALIKIYSAFKEFPSEMDEQNNFQEEFSTQSISPKSIFCIEKNETNEKSGEERSQPQIIHVKSNVTINSYFETNLPENDTNKSEMPIFDLTNSDDEKKKRKNKRKKNKKLMITENDFGSSSGSSVHRSKRKKDRHLERPPPNTNKELYFISKAIQKCVFCPSSSTRIISHYKNKHSSEEVYASRLSPKMAERLRAEDFGRFDAHNKIKGYCSSIYAMCFFCGEAKLRADQTWLDHIRRHTGEYRNICLICNADVMEDRHCGCTTEPVKSKVTAVDLMCFICKDCNFVQLERKNMQTHLIKQHGADKKEIDSQYEVKLLLPSRDTIQRETGNENNYSIVNNLIFLIELHILITLSYLS